MMCKGGMLVVLEPLTANLGIKYNTVMVASVASASEPARVGPFKAGALGIEGPPVPTPGLPPRRSAVSRPQVLPKAAAEQPLGQEPEPVILWVSHVGAAAGTGPSQGPTGIGRCGAR